MSPERLKGAERSAANDIWSVGATFVYMISLQPLNYLDTITQLKFNISEYKVCINENPYSVYLQTLNENHFKKKVISRTLCNELHRANWQQLFRILFLQSKRLPAEALMEAGDDNDPSITGMSYNSARDELFLANGYNGVMRSMRVRDNAGDLCDVNRAPHDKSSLIRSVCHMSDSDTLLLCSSEEGPGGNYANWLVALSRNGS